VEMRVLKIADNERCCEKSKIMNTIAAKDCKNECLCGLACVHVCMHAYIFSQALFDGGIVIHYCDGSALFAVCFDTPFAELIKLGKKTSINASLYGRMVNGGSAPSLVNQFQRLAIGSAKT